LSAGQARAGVKAREQLKGAGQEAAPKHSETKAKSLIEKDQNLAFFSERALI